MKRKGNIYNDMISMDNLRVAHLRARKGKSKQRGVIAFEANLEANLWQLHIELVTKTYRTSTYYHFVVRDPKERKISSLPFRDRVVHHLIMMPLEKLFVSTFTADTYSCIKGRGVHKAKEALTKQLKRVPGKIYCLKMDVRQFYPSVDNEILKTIIRKKVKDKDLLNLLDEIIDSAVGLPIGNLLSQYFANLYLCYLDHFIKQQLGVTNYCKYADDMVIVDNDIKYLHAVRALIQEYLWCELNLELKGNYQVFPVCETNGRPVDFAGYPQYPTHIRIRKKSKQKFARMIKRAPNRESIASCHGWAKHADTKNLLNKLKDEYNKIIQRSGDKVKESYWPKSVNRTGSGQRNKNTRLSGRRQQNKPKSFANPANNI